MKKWLLYLATIITCSLSLAAENPILYIGPKGSISLYVNLIWYTAQPASEVPGIVLFTRHSKTEIPQQIQEQQFLDIAQRTPAMHYQRIQHQIRRWKTQRIPDTISIS